MTPLFTSACDLAERIPAMAADFLELESKIGRRFREDSVTDIVIASLLKIGGSNATVLVPPEPKTGGDFDIVLVEPANGDAVQYRIQAKRLVPHATNWDWSAYRELDHPHGTGRQSSTLIRSSAREAVPTIPLYAFYNPEAVCAASSGAVAGIQLADGRTVNEIVKALVKAKRAGKRPRWKRLEHLRHLFFPLSTILCPPGGGTPGATFLSPRMSRMAVETAIEDRRHPPWDWAEAQPQIPRQHSDRPPLLPAADSYDVIARRRGRAVSALPAIVERAVSRRPDEPPIQKARVKRPRLILVSRDREGGKDA